MGCSPLFVRNGLGKQVIKRAEHREEGSEWLIATGQITINTVCRESSRRLCHSLFRQLQNTALWSGEKANLPGKHFASRVPHGSKQSWLEKLELE
jgi:hypothetical protein